MAERPLQVLILGTGIAGLTAALLAERKGHQVTLVTKSRDPRDSNSSWAQGGIIFRGRGDSPGLLANDILEASGGMALPKVVRLVAEEGPEAVEEVLLGLAHTPFASNDGKTDWKLTREAAHSVPRILHVADRTGEAIVDSLLAAVRRRKSIQLLTDSLAVDLITIPHHSRDPLSVYQGSLCLGAYVWSVKDRKVRSVFADRVVLATGGIGQVYARTTNPLVATGDGIALAGRAGCRIVNMEYTQFHPTTLAVPGAANFLISEAVRGEGGVLLDDAGKDFTRKSDKRGSLAPRDVVTRAIQRELERNARPHVWLSLEKVGGRIETRFPTIFRKCLDFKIDIRKEPIPVAPAFHFSCGGVLTDENGQSTLPNLYAIGEVACTGLHGANRLASTSLLEGVVFARRAVHHLSESPFRSAPFRKEIQPWVDRNLTESHDPVLLRQDWNTLQSTMWNYVGILRTPGRLQRAIETLRDLRSQVDHFYWKVRIGREMVELRNAIQTAITISKSALKNPRSAGGHFIEEK